MEASRALAVDIATSTAVELNGSQATHSPSMLPEPVGLESVQPSPVKAFDAAIEAPAMAANSTAATAGLAEDLSHTYSKPEHQPTELFPADERMQKLQAPDLDLKARQDAFTSIVRQYTPDLTRYTRYLVKSSSSPDDLTADIVQETFLRLWIKAEKFTHRPENPDSLKAWLLKIALNLVRGAHKAKSKRETPLPEILGLAADPRNRARSEVMFGDANRLDDPLEIIQGRQVNLAAIRSVIPPSSFKALILRDVFGYSPVEIAELLGSSEASVHGLVHRGRKTVRSNDALRQKYRIAESGNDA